jgi:bacteriocin-like protein
MNTNTNTSGMSEIRELTEFRELTDDELDAVDGGAFNGYFRYGCANGSHIAADGVEGPSTS